MRISINGKFLKKWEYRLEMPFRLDLANGVKLSRQRIAQLKCGS